MALPRFRIGSITLALALLGTGGMLFAQVSGVTTSSPAPSSGTFEVGGVEVDVTAKTAEAARYAGWRLAQRKGWQMLSQRLGHPSTLPDGTLDGLVSGIIVENEQLGPHRYIARLGVAFDRARAGAILGIAGDFTRSSPMLLIPVEWSGGVGTAFEQRSDWQEAWNRFRAGNSSVDYVRVTGTGPDRLLLNAGQVSRPGRGWWRSVLDQYGASDVLMPTVTLYRQWPGGPVVAMFDARHGPDNRSLGRFELRVDNAESLPALLDAGTKRLDEVYARALASGELNVDTGLELRPPTPTPTPTATATDEAAVESDQPVTDDSTSSTLTVQFDSPSAGAVNAAEAALRGVPGVRSAETVSLALGGVSVMRVSYAGDAAVLAQALEQRGWQVTASGTTLRIRRAPTIQSPNVSDLPG